MFDEPSESTDMNHTSAESLNHGGENAKKPILNWSNHFREICMFIQQNLMNFHGKVSLFQN